MKRPLKSLIALLLLVCTLVSLCGCARMLVSSAALLPVLLWNVNNKAEGLDRYQEDAEEFECVRELLPEPSQFSDAEDTVYHQRHREYAFFYSDSFAFFVTYSEELYPEKKDEVLSGYEFRDAPVTAADGDQILPAVEFSYRGFQMKAAETGEEEYMACKKVLLIGCNDATCQIAYCLFYDYDLDYIATATEDPTRAMQNFVEENFYWVS